ncbi:hypothetical protein PJWF_00040 [Achromobacter phage JWF]|uniref:hypothetical protein n=1 Tax=Achromobacter phage JWF TaxID=1589748 RepID=UPI000588E812|nr:hypothetical protein AXJ13_gp040 [Achromobacter phage JWF]AJD82934.1 hypothetical protein PJWF_00040 [Achromobacter phage JWF]
MNLKPTITAVVIEDSISPAGLRVTTLALRYPRIVHAEFMTHRAFSRNAGSSRAIPTAKMLRQIRREPAAPVSWGRNQPGMQAGEELTGWRLWGVKATWLALAKISAFGSWIMMKLGAHKQVANRVTEPYQYMNTLVTSTDWSNWEQLRCHPDADPTIQDLAIEIMTALDVSTPTPLGFDEWHLPYVTEKERRDIPLASQLKLSTARCARVSFAPFDGNAQYDKEFQRHDHLVSSRPVHSSPTEHQCRPMGGTEMQFGNLRGWRQYRYQVEAEALQRDLASNHQPMILRRSWSPEEHALHARGKELVQRHMQQNVLRNLGTAELPITTTFTRGRVSAVGAPDPNPLSGQPGAEFILPFGAIRVQESLEKSSDHGGLTFHKDIRTETKGRGGYPYPLDPHFHDAPVKPLQEIQDAFSSSTQADPSPSSSSGAGSDSGGSSND